VPVPEGAEAATAPSPANKQGSPSSATANFGEPKVLGTLQDTDVKESSGLVASRANPGFYWTHNDSGDGPFIYAFDEHCKSYGVWRVSGARADDWEDIAAGPGPQQDQSYLYIGDIGDNGGRRSEIIVYRVVEPTITADNHSTKKNPQLTEAAEAIRLRYPDDSYNAEALLVHPTSGNLYVITKVTLGSPTVFEARAPFSTDKAITMSRMTQLNMPSLLGGMITAGDISPDGQRVVLCDYFRGYELTLQNPASSFDTIWKQPLKVIELGDRKQGEAIAYRLNGKAVLTTSEGRSSPVIEVVRR